jgi:hypothetical protein
VTSVVVIARRQAARAVALYEAEARISKRAVELLAIWL